MSQSFQSTLPTRGSDRDKCRGGVPCRISIHAPHEGERQEHKNIKIVQVRFQSTLPTRGSDIFFIIMQSHFQHFNPRSPRGGATTSCTYNIGTVGYFNPRSPRGGATEREEANARAAQISIHAPHEGERGNHHGGLATAAISIHAPHEGERHDPPSRIRLDKRFQSTLPTRGSDLIRGVVIYHVPYFNPRSPRGGATLNSLGTDLLGGISIHAPHEGERRRELPRIQCTS